MYHREVPLRYVVRINNIRFFDSYTNVMPDPLQGWAMLNMFIVGRLLLRRFYYSSE